MIAILGGGITALSAAIELQKRGLDFIILESSENCGGKIQSIEKQGFILETGPNTVLINNPETEQFIKDLGLEDELIFSDQEAVKKRWVLKNGKAEAIPNSPITALRSNLFGINTLFSILSEPFKKRRTDKSEESLADFSRRRFGKQIYEDLITPFISGIYAGDPERMSIDHTLSILKEAEDKGGSVLRGMPNVLKARAEARNGWKGPKNKIFSFKRGLGELTEKAAQLLQDKLILNAQVENISRKEGEYLISYSHNGIEEKIAVDQIISTIPAYALSKVIFDQELAKELKKVNYVPAVVCHFGIKKEDLLWKEKSFGLLSRKSENVPFLGVLFNSFFFPHTSKEDEFLITVISGGYRQPKLIHKEDKLILNEVLSALKELKIVKGEAIMKHVFKWEKAIPQYELGYSSILAKMEEFEVKNPSFKLAGNYNKGISVSDCIAKGAKLAAELN